MQQVHGLQDGFSTFHCRHTAHVTHTHTPGTLTEKVMLQYLGNVTEMNQVLIILQQMKCRLVYSLSNKFQISSCRRKDSHGGILALRHFTSDLTGALRAPFITSSVTMSSCNTKAFGLRSVTTEKKQNKTDFQTFREMLETLFTTFKTGAMTLQRTQIMYTKYTRHAPINLSLHRRPPTAGAFMRGTESGRSSLTSSGSRARDGPLDLMRARRRSPRVTQSG